MCLAWKFSFKKIIYLGKNCNFFQNWGLEIFNGIIFSETVIIFWIRHTLKFSIFFHGLIWTNLLYLDNYEDLGDGVGDIFAR